VKCVLPVAQEHATGLTAKRALTDVGYLVDVTRNAEEAITLFDAKLHDVVVTAEAMPSITGAELAHMVKLRSPRTPVVLLAERAATEDRSCLDAVLENGAYARGLTSALQEVLVDAG
jgi:CheY-like chemotaxis protein